ncbi:MAG: ribonuclease E/G, partial [Rhodoferax sp.]|nr:ribonuclease E/G [Rhodoferax sp.]
SDRPARQNDSAGTEAGVPEFNRLNTLAAEGGESMPNPDAATGQTSGHGQTEGGQEGRDKRSRDRYGRERGSRGDRNDRGDRQDRPADENRQEQGQATATERQERAFDAVQPAGDLAPQMSVPTAPVTVTVAPAISVAPQVVAAAAPAAKGLPKVQSFELPLDQLAQIAQASGLSWVNSNAEKIAQVQAAIAAEPKPAHVPRERPAPVQLDEGPLVLVETRRDLRDLVLPFEDTTPGQ